ncbi:MAG: hypothetical protein U0237_02625 [Thermoleophilia bacterium]
MSPASRTGRAAGRWALRLVVVAALVAASGWAVSYRATYHLWPGESIPPRIHWCGRDYDRGPGEPETLRQIRKFTRAEPVVVGHVPPIRSHDLLAETTEQAVRQRDPSASGCTTLVFLRLSADRYLVYELSGSL